MELAVTIVSLLLAASAGGVIAYAWRNSRGWALQHAVAWLALAWVGWIGVSVAQTVDVPSRPMAYIALVTTAAAAVAVLGARKPGVAAWNFVVLGFLAVLSLPLFEQSWSRSEWAIDEPRALFLACTLAIGVVNYLPTRWGVVALAFGALLGYQLWLLTHVHPGGEPTWPARLLPGVLGGLTWCAWLLLRRGERRRVRAPGGPGADAAGLTEISDLWLAFRERYGLVWGKRVQEQFNHSAQNAGWAERLGWCGLTGNQAISPERLAEARELLASLLKRFVPTEFTVE